LQGKAHRQMPVTARDKSIFRVYKQLFTNSNMLVFNSRSTSPRTLILKFQEWRKMQHYLSITVALYSIVSLEWVLTW